MDKVTAYQLTTFHIVMIVTYVAYFLALIGMTVMSPTDIQWLDYFLKLYISLFLIWRFNFLRKIKFNELDREIGFQAGVFLILTTIVNTATIAYLNSLKTTVVAKIPVLGLIPGLK